jgi:hypothetical protein
LRAAGSRAARVAPGRDGSCVADGAAADTAPAGVAAAAAAVAAEGAAMEVVLVVGVVVVVDFEDGDVDWMGC